MAIAQARAQIIGPAQVLEKELLVFAPWNMCHPRATVNNGNPRRRVLRATGREEFYESLDSSKPFASHRIAPWEPWIEEIVTRYCGTWARQKGSKINILDESLFSADDCQHVGLRRRGTTLVARECFTDFQTPVSGA